MAIHRIPKSSSKLAVYLVNRLLNSSLSPGLEVEPHTIDKSRKSMNLWGKLMPVARGVKVNSDVLNGVSCDIHKPKSHHKEKVLLYFHGGGYCVGSPLSHRHIVSRLAKETNLKAVVPDYRKAPEHRFPAPIEDAVSVYQGLLEQGVLPRDIYFCGDSAGGNLVLSTLLRLKENGDPLPAAASCISPWTDLSMSGVSIEEQAEHDFLLSKELLNQFASHYAPEHEEDLRKHHHISPLFAELEGLPPLLIQVGSREVLLDDSVRLLENAREAGVNAQLQIWEDMQHVWHYSFTMLKDGRNAITSIAQFFDKHQ